MHRPSIKQAADLRRALRLRQEEEERRAHAERRRTMILAALLATLAAIGFWMVWPG